MRSPIQAHKCGHRFCAKCIEKYHETSDGIVCPFDRQPIEIFKDIGREREILEMKVYCKNRPQCSWQSELRYFEDHMKECLFETIDCDMNCGIKVLRSDMRNHLENDCLVEFPCQYQSIGCLFTGSKRSLTEHMVLSTNQHLLFQMQHEVRKVKQDFDEKLKAKDLQLRILGERLKTVEGEIVVLRNEKKKMSAEIKTKNDKMNQLDAKLIELEDLVEDNQLKNYNKLGDMAKAIDGLKVENQKAVAKIDTFSHPFILKIDNFDEQFKQAKTQNNIIRSRPFLCLGQYKGQLKLYLNGNSNGIGTHISIFFCLIEGPLDDMIEWPMKWKKCTIELIINDTVIGSHILRGVNENFKNFKRPTFAENETGKRGPSKFVDHKDIPHIIRDDIVTIKFEIH
eukprot:TCONS_00022522-protein